MWSRMLTEARPVRMLDISCCKSAMAFSMRVLAFASISLIELNGVALGAEGSVFIMATSHYSASMAFKSFKMCGLLNYCRFRAVRLGRKRYHKRHVIRLRGRWGSGEKGRGRGIRYAPWPSKR